MIGVVSMYMHKKLKRRIIADNKTASTVKILLKLNPVQCANVAVSFISDNLGKDETCRNRLNTTKE
jgi:hypothetical protein